MTTPPVPQWAVEAAKEIETAGQTESYFNSARIVERIASIIAAHAPQDGSHSVATWKAKYDAAMKAIDECAADGARLDWLERTLAGVWYNRRISEFTVQAVHQVCGCMATDRTIRAAIDAARQKDL